MQIYSPAYFTFPSLLLQPKREGRERWAGTLHYFTFVRIKWRQGKSLGPKKVLVLQGAHEGDWCHLRKGLLRTHPASAFKKVSPSKFSAKFHQGILFKPWISQMWTSLSCDNGMTCGMIWLAGFCVHWCSLESHFFLQGNPRKTFIHTWKLFRL